MKNNKEVCHELKEMKKVNNLKAHGASPIPQEGHWDKLKFIEQVNGFSHGVGGCAPQQGACKLTLNVKDGIIMEALIETIGCSGMTHSAAMAGEILPGKTLLEALNTDLVCDAINVAMKNLFLQLVYGRSQSAFSECGLQIGAALEDLGKHRASQIGTIFGCSEKGTRYLALAEGIITKMALDTNKEIIGYEFVKVQPLVEFLENGMSGKDALKLCTKTYGRFNEGVDFINPRKE